jgi:hypothetical protein
MTRVRTARADAEIRVLARWTGMLALINVCSCAAADDEPTASAAAGEEPGGDGGGGSATGATGATATSGGTGATGGVPTSCDYPPGPYGVHTGDLVDAAAVWEGFPAGATVAQTMVPSDYLDCDGSKGIHALLILQSATWCAPCQIEAAALQGKLDQGWSDLGVAVLTLMVEQQPEQPATVATAQAWKNEFGLSSAAVAADPQFTFDAFDFDKHIPHSGFPTQLLVDPRTMKIVVRQDSDIPLDAQVEQLAADNQ